MKMLGFHHTPRHGVVGIIETTSTTWDIGFPKKYQGLWRVASCKK